MNPIIYEHHSHEDPKFPIIFHYDTLDCTQEKFIVHYHENIEVLYFIKGSGMATCGSNHVKVCEGDLLVVNSNELHFVYTNSPQLEYYCLIIDHILCDYAQIPTENLVLQNLIEDAFAVECMENIIQEMMTKKSYYKSAVQGQVFLLLTHLYRYYSATKVPIIGDTWNHKMEIVKKAIGYIKNHFTQELTIDGICKEVGLSKYYMCRIFKEVTGQTVIEYINFLRCDYARSLLISGKYNVKESAEKCGIPNLSYFSKTYKRYMSKLPSQESALDPLS